MNSLRARLGLLAAGLLALLPAAPSAQTVFVQPPESIPAEESFTLAIVLDCADAGVLGVEIALSFDASLVRLEGIDPGAWFTGSGVDWFFWDYTHPGTELIHFTGSLLGSASAADGELAVCRFTALDPGVSPLDFLTVEVRDFQNQDLDAAHSYGDRIVIDQAIPDRAVGFGSLKAIYR